MGIPTRTAALCLFSVFHFVSAGAAQTVVATDETLKTQLVELTGWNMGNAADPDKDLFPAPLFACGKAVSLSVTILSDPTANGKPYVDNFVRMNRLRDLKNERGGSMEIQCFQDNPSWLEISLKQHHYDPGQTSYFITATLQSRSYRFESLTARRGWIKIEYYP
ncbi:MAG TPA: hypothetical protein VJ385_07490 [Fibrobacteria bacterium]|nr:hypothetical protein [Fibrobacteria bacterium]